MADDSGVYMGNQRIIAFGIDNSDYAEKAFDWYMENIRKHDDVIVLIHCPETYDFTMASPAVVKQLLDELEKSVKELEDKYREKVQAKGIDGKFRTGAGKPGEVILKIAKDEKATMIITGTRGLGPRSEGICLTITAKTSNFSKRLSQG